MMIGWNASSAARWCRPCDVGAASTAIAAAMWWTIAISSHALRRKPMALLNLVYREQLFPREAYRHAWDALIVRLPARNACRTMVGLLALAHDRACEAELAIELEAILGTGELPDLALLRQQFAPPGTVVPTVTVTLPAAITYDALLGSPQEWLRP